MKILMEIGHWHICSHSRLSKNKRPYTLTTAVNGLLALPHFWVASVTGQEEARTGKRGRKCEKIGSPSMRGPNQNAFDPSPEVSLSAASHSCGPFRWRPSVYDGHPQTTICMSGDILPHWDPAYLAYPVLNKFSTLISDASVIVGGSNDQALLLHWQYRTHLPSFICLVINLIHFSWQKTAKHGFLEEFFICQLVSMLFITWWFFSLVLICFSFF